MPAAVFARGIRRAAREKWRLMRGSSVARAVPRQRVCCPADDILRALPSGRAREQSKRAPALMRVYCADAGGYLRDIPSRKLPFDARAEVGRTRPTCAATPGVSARASVRLRHGVTASRYARMRLLAID